MDLKEKIKKLPSSTGVYLMKDSLDSVLYVGKSKNLKSRVGSYFQNSKSHPPKVVKLVKHLKDFDYILTDTEFEAFMLENKLIKEINPIYNRLLKSPRSYSFIKINISEEYPSIETLSESSKSDGNLYFGPYTNKNTVERGLQGIKECCKILCTSASRKSSSCLNYSLGLCIGICMDDAPRGQYLAILDKIVKLLSGTDKSIIEAMEYNMDSASEKLDFEKAAKYRDYIRAVNYLIGKAKVVEYTKKNKNIVVLEHLSEDRVKLFLIKGNKVLFSEKYSLEDIDFEELKIIMKTNVLAYFNNKTQKGSIEVDREAIDESQIIYSYLNTKPNNCRHVIIKENWLNASSNAKIEKALDKLFAPPHKRIVD
ncbi:MAG TPA: UvrB/UvrC motif-containing protein [Clostridia bacterium]|nr:UvrB/UvrC motif-containing protein [Clostridia bacterium]